VSEFHAEASQATASEGLAQGLYVAATAGFEPFERKSWNLPMSHHTHKSSFDDMMLLNSKQQRHRCTADCILSDDE